MPLNKENNQTFSLFPIVHFADELVKYTYIYL